jgi:glycosyltransferase involved in cell wall biosynthesis
VIGISLLTLVPGVVGGSERYARELCRALARVGELDYRVFVPTIAKDAAGPLPSTVVPSYRAARSMPGRIVAMTMAAAAPWPVRRQLALDELDAIHFPLSVMLPPVRRPQAVSSILDIQHEFLPQLFSAAELRYRKLVYGWTARRSRIVITISEHARETLIERLGLPQHRVHTIHLGVDHERFTPSFAEREPFLLYPANYWLHKNHDRLFEAFQRVRLERHGLRLVLTGHGHRDLRLPVGVESRGRVSDAELVQLLQTASALVFPSLYEGFGLPPVEAMACGCPVASSSAGSLPEICADAAVLFDPSDPGAIAAGVEEALTRSRELAVAGPERAATFTWEATARAHDQVYAEVG